MFTVRREQLQRFQDALESGFVRMLAASLRERHVEMLAALDDDDLLARVAEGVNTAVEQGLEHESSIAVFVGLQFIAGPEFYRFPPIASALNRGTGSADDRLAAAIQNLPAAAWGAARRAYQADVRGGKD
jgi:hypothetical protein